MPDATARVDADTSRVAWCVAGFSIAISLAAIIDIVVLLAR